MIFALLLGVALVGTLSSTVFLVLAVLGARSYRRASRERRWPEGTPLVSVLKPVHGMEPSLSENLESYFRQDYPNFELLFCARDQSDAGLAVARELAAKYPNVKSRILTSGEPPFANAKVYSMMAMAGAAAGDILILSDSDVYAGPAYVREVSAPLRDPKVGAVTCMYRGRPVNDFWALLEGLGMTVEMSAGVLIARLLEGMKFALGPTMATRKDVVAKIGGLRQLGEYCADDFVLGNLAARAGYEVVLSAHVIDHMARDIGFLESFTHQARWMRSTRYSRPKGHFGAGLTFAMPFGIVGFIAGWLAGFPVVGIGLLLGAIANRMLLSLVVGWVTLSDRRSLVYAWLYPLRDLLGSCVWLASYSGNELVWRGQRYKLEFGGKMLPVGAKATEAAGS